MNRVKKEPSMDAELEGFWTGHLTPSQFEEVQQSLFELARPEPDVDLKYRLLDIENGSGVSWFDKIALRGLLTAGATLALVLLTLAYFPKNNTLQTANLSESPQFEQGVSEDDLVALADYEGDESSEDVLDSNLQMMEQVIWNA